jgi:asparagine synthase (glutamine-hydrolysing)
VQASNGDVLVRLAGRLADVDELSRTLRRGPDDTAPELLAAAWRRWGAELLPHISGAFALLVWERSTRTGLLACDQLGGRSLFLAESGRRLVFATEIQPLLRVLERRPGPDHVALVHWLVDHSSPGRRTLFEGVVRLGAGHTLVLGERDWRRRRWWRPRYAVPLGCGQDGIADLLRQGLRGAVGRATPSRTPAAVLLSGGLDSSIVAALASERAPVHALCAVFPGDPELDEARWQDAAIGAHSLRATRVRPVAAGALASAAEFVSTWGIPLQVPGVIIERPLLEAAAAIGLDVVLDGQGGDELFGTAVYLIADELRRGHPLSATRLARRYPGIGVDPSSARVRYILMEVGVRGALPIRLHDLLRHRGDRTRWAPDWLTPESALLHVETSDPWRWKRDTGVPLWWSQLADVLTTGRERADIADYLRRRAAVAGVEARSPLLDVQLVELALRLPPELGFEPTLPRALVRQAMAGVLPEVIRRRRHKSDFSAFYQRTLAHSDFPAIARLLGDRSAEVGAYVDLGAVRERLLGRLGEPGPEGRLWTSGIWNLVTAEVWLRTQADPDWPDNARSRGDL